MIKTTSGVQIYEPKLKLFWQEFKCDAYHKGLACFVNTLSYDYIKDVDLLKLESISAINNHKPIKKTAILDKLCKDSGGEFQAIRYSIDNVRSVENLSVRM